MKYSYLDEKEMEIHILCVYQLFFADLGIDSELQLAVGTQFIIENHPQTDQSELQVESNMSLASSAIGHLRCSKCHTTFANDYSINKHAKFCVGSKGSSVLNSILLPHSSVTAHQSANSAEVVTDGIKSKFPSSGDTHKLFTIQPQSGDDSVLVCVTVDDSVRLVNGEHITEAMKENPLEAPPTLIVGEVANALMSLSKADTSDGGVSQEIVVSALPDGAVIYQPLQSQEDLGSNTE